jgi:hypothetical protein
LAGLMAVLLLAGTDSFWGDASERPRFAGAFLLRAGCRACAAV